MTQAVSWYTPNKPVKQNPCLAFPDYEKGTPIIKMAHLMLLKIFNGNGIKIYNDTIQVREAWNLITEIAPADAMAAIEVSNFMIDWAEKTRLWAESDEKLTAK